MPRGFFITFEGIDGCGKSTQLKRLAAHLRASGVEVVTTRQPGGTPFGDRLRTLLLDSRTGPLDSSAELAMMFADRAQCIDEVIAPALADGKIVLCDRFTDSTEAYQGGGRELGSDAVLTMHRVVCGGLQPDMTLLLRPDFDGCLRRARRRNDTMSARGTDENRFEQEQTEFYRRVAAKYDEIAAREPVRVVTIDGDLSIDAVHERIVHLVMQRLTENAVTRGTI
jgi:dTMP kinase